MNDKKYLLSIESKGIKLGLNRTKELSARCQDPHENLKTIQVAGTNGKGSTCAILSSILLNANYKVGLFTSPHLVSVNERIRINGIPISDNHISEYIQLYKNDIEETSASFFETITIMAFWYFKKMNVDYAIMETGLGGRLDSVTICSPIASVITSISLDHAEILGDTIKKITNEKIGIIKHNTPCITIKHSQDEVNKIIKQECSEKNAPLFISDNLHPLDFQPGISGQIHHQNSQLAKRVIESINIKGLNEKNIINGIQNVKWHGRNQTLQQKPLVVFDVAHNESGINSFIHFFQSIASGKKILILSLQKRKNIASQVDNIMNLFDEVIICETKNKRTMTIQELQKYFNEYRNKVQCIKSDYQAIHHALNQAQSADSIGIIGTHHLGDAISEIFNISFNLI